MIIFYKLAMLLNVIWAVDTLLAQEVNFSNLLASFLGFSLALQGIVVHYLRIELERSRFLQQASRVIITETTHEELDELRRQLNAGLMNNAAKYTLELYEKYEKKDG